MILLIDNYDSFVQNLARYVGMLGRERRVVRNDAITIKEIAQNPPDAIILSPGPCTPAQAGPAGARASDARPAPALWRRPTGPGSPD